MDYRGDWRLTVTELEGLLAAAEPAARMVPARIVRRVIKQDRQIPGPGLRVPHRKTFSVPRSKLLAIVEPDELGLAPEETHTLGETVLLVARPDAEKLTNMPRPRALVKHWRQLFHVRVHAALEERIRGGQLTPEVVRQRVDALGRLEFEEIRGVLRQDEYLLPPADETSVYVEFVAVYLELRHFAPDLVRDYFPTLRDFEAVDSLVREDVDDLALLSSSRLHGAPEPADQAASDDDAVTFAADPQAANPRKQSDRAYCRWMARADRARARGNAVRSAMLRARAALVIGPKLARAARAEGRADLEKLAWRLRAALNLEESQTAAWAEALGGMLAPAIRGIWTPEARFLYDLQKVCLDHERGSFHLDLRGWLMSLGRRALRRPLARKREVLLVQHLRRASQRIKSVRLPHRDRERLATLVSQARDHTEKQLRSALRPLLSRALDEVRLAPRNLPEVAAQLKLIEELLDRIVSHGFLTIGNLRDAVSRNNLKLDDVVGAAELLSGDQLLQVDRRLSGALEGVYRPGEVYLRLPQFLSSLAFGTPAGRFLTRFGIVPFGGAFVVLEFLQHSWSEVAKRTGGVTPPIRSLGSILLLGCFLFGVLHNAAFREGCASFFRALGRAVRWLVVEGPAQLLRHPLVQALLASPWLRRAEQFVLKPLMFTLLLVGTRFLLVRHLGTWLSNGAIFVAMNVLLNSRLGRDVDELVTDWAVRSWHQLRIRVFAALARFIVDLFAQFMEALDRFLYTVDEWLRFRTGEAPPVTWTKAVLACGWSFVHYFVRFCVTLLIEPQVNPIKHFPVVTVSHKIILPLGFPLVKMLAPHLGVAEANTLVWSTIWLVPGIFGFLVWELKENWRLYAANRPANLQPVIVELRHGETITRLLRPALHSGTCPKRYARLRRADRRAYATGRWTAPRKHREALAHVGESVRRFVERDLLALLDLSPDWRHGTIEVGEVRVGWNNLQVELVARELPGTNLRLILAERSGWTVGQIAHPGWLAELGPEDLDVFAKALAGFYKMCGVELIQEQIELASGRRRELRIVEQGLRLSGWDTTADPVTYVLRPGTEAQIAASNGRAAPVCLPPLERKRTVFSSTAISWEAWVQMWPVDASPGRWTRENGNADASAGRPHHLGGGAARGCPLTRRIAFRPIFALQ